MSTYTCPDGHTSAASDYCDVCGAPIGPAAPGAAAPSAAPPSLPGAAAAGSSLDLDSAAPAAPPAAVAATDQECPNCASTQPAAALFCESCGYDFVTGQMPRPLAPPDGAPPAPQAVDAGSSDPAVTVQPPPSDPAPAQLPPTAQPPDGIEWVVEVWVDPDWHAAQDVDDPCPSAGMPVVVPLRQRSVLIGRTSTSRNIHPEVDVTGDTGVSRRHAQLTTDGLRWWIEDLGSANGTYVGGAGQPLPTDPVSGRVELTDDGRIYLGAWSRLVVRKASPAERTAG